MNPLENAKRIAKELHDAMLMPEVDRNTIYGTWGLIHLTISLREELEKIK